MRQNRGKRGGRWKDEEEKKGMGNGTEEKEKKY